MQASSPKQRRWLLVVFVLVGVLALTVLVKSRQTPELAPPTERSRTVPVVRQLGRTDSVVSVAVTGPMAVTDLKAYAEQLKDRLPQLPAVSLVTVDGFSQRQLSVRFPQRVLEQYGLSVHDIADIIGRQSIDLPSGSIRTRERELFRGWLAGDRFLGAAISAILRL